MHFAFGYVTNDSQIRLQGYNWATKYISQFSQNSSPFSVLTYKRYANPYMFTFTKDLIICMTKLMGELLELLEFHYCQINYHIYGAC